MREGTFVDVTLIAAPPSTNDKDGHAPQAHCAVVAVRGERYPGNPVNGVKPPKKESTWEKNTDDRCLSGARGAGRVRRFNATRHA